MTSTASSIIGTDFAPVTTNFPEEKTKIDTFGFFILTTTPGNCSGIYDTCTSPGKRLAALSSLILHLKSTEATTF